MGAPRSLGQHVGGMILSSSPIPELAPVRAGAMDGRYIMDWNKDSVQDAGFAKIDILSLPVLDQIEEALDLIERRTGERPDMSRISPRDDAVYDMINAGRSKGVFLLQSPAQLKIAQRLRSRNLRDLAYQVALIRPGVGMQGSAVSQFIDRYRHGVEWGLRPSPRETSAGTWLGHHSVAGAGGAARHGCGRDERGAGGRGAPRLRKAQQRASDSDALAAVFDRSASQRCFRRSG